MACPSASSVRLLKFLTGLVADDQLEFDKCKHAVLHGDHDAPTLGTPEVPGYGTFPNLVLRARSPAVAVFYAPTQTLNRLFELPPLEPVGPHPRIVPARSVRLTELAPRDEACLDHHRYQQRPTFGQTDARKQWPAALPRRVASLPRASRILCCGFLYRSQLTDACWFSTC